MPPSTPKLQTSHSVDPNSPPQSPTTTSSAFNRKNRPSKKRSIPPQNPHLRRPMQEPSNIRPVGNGPTFSYTRQVRLEQLSPQSSSSSAESDPGSPGRPGSPASSDESEEIEMDAERLAPPPRVGRVVTHASFIVEEMSDFNDSDEDRLDVVKPHAIEYAESDRSRSRSRNPPEIDRAIIYHLGNLNCSDDSDQTDVDEIEHREFLARQREEKRRKRMTSGSIGKRTISESIGSDSDREDLRPFLDISEVGSSARRLRRRVGDRRSLQFQDPPPRIEELEERSTSDDEQEDGEVLARELPYYTMEYITMEIDSP